MKTIKNYLLLFAVIMTFTSCLVDDDVITDGYDQGPNIVGFSSGSQNANALADGTTTEIMVPVIVTGPTSLSITQDVDVTIEVDASSTAIAGTHYSFDVSSLTLMASDGLVGNLPVTIITDGILPPLAEAPQLVLNLTSTSASNSVISGRTGQVVITINYLCFSNLAGDYIVNYGSGPFIHTVTELSDGLYEMSSMFGWPTSGYVVTFTDVCGELTLINDWQFSNEIGASGTVDFTTGDLNWTGVFVEAVYSDASYTMIKQ